MKILILAATLIGAAQGWAAGPAPAPAAAPDAVPKAYKANCALCHGVNAAGNKAMAKAFKLEPAAMDLVNGDAAGKTEAELTQIIAGGKGKMPAYKKKLDQDQLQGLARFLVSLRPPKAASKAAPAK